MRFGSVLAFFSVSLGYVLAEISSEAAATTSTGLPVPPLKELGKEDFEAITKNGYWFVKHYSPYCIHCKKVAPTWQTLYENFMRFSPLTPSSPHAATSPTFEETYNFHFTNINCVLQGDLCESHNVQAYPMFALYKDGKFVEEFKGDKTLKAMTSYVEGYLEKIKPGTYKPSTLEGSESKATQIGPSQPDSAVHENTPEEKGPPANLEGLSESFNSASFEKKVTATRDAWFIKFYAPWCHHCQAMAPNWRIMATEMKGQLNVGEVNCEVEKKLCKEAKINGYPSIVFFKDGSRVDYDGLRGAGDLVDWAKKAANSGIKTTNDAADYEALEKKHEVLFLYFYNQATTPEDFATLDKLTLPLIGHAPLLKTNSDLLARKFKITTWPRLIVVRDGRPLYYNALSPSDMRDSDRILKWMQSVWLPMVTEITASNSHEVVNKKLVVLAILDKTHTERFESAKKEMKAAAVQWLEYRQQERQELRDEAGDEKTQKNARNTRTQLSAQKEVGFAWIDGVFWERWLKATYGIEVQTMGERVIINDEDNKLFWDETRNGDIISLSHSLILSTVKDVIQNKSGLKAKSSVGAFHTAFRRITSSVSNHPLLAMFFFFASLFVGASWWRGRSRRSQNYHPFGIHPNSKEDGLWSSAQGWLGNEKSGLFSNGNGAGKYD